MFAYVIPYRKSRSELKQKSSFLIGSSASRERRGHHLAELFDPNTRMSLNTHTHNGIYFFFVFV